MSAEHWAELVEAWGASGRTAAAFAAEQGIAESSLRWWKTELTRRARRQVARRSPGLGREIARVSVARVVREGEAPPVAVERAKRSIELVVGGVRVVIESGFDAQLLREVVRALGGRS